MTLECKQRPDDETVFGTSQKPVAQETSLAEVQLDREYATLTVNIGDAQFIEKRD